MPSLTPRERSRRRYLPSPVRVLFVGESPPAGGTFFYDANSKLYRETKRAFEAAFPEVRSRLRGMGEAEFLNVFKELGCYLDDLCAEPVNGFSPIERIAARRAGEADLARRIRRLKPQAIVGVMIGIGENVARACQKTGTSVPYRLLPFPGRPEHTSRYVQELSETLRRFRRSGLLPPCA